MGLLSAIDAARSALRAHELALDVGAGNVANVHTPGYARRRVLLADGGLPDGPYGPLGGVTVVDVRRVVDPLVEQRLRGLGTETTESETLRAGLAALANLSNDLDDAGVAGAVRRFFDAAASLALDPQSLAVREVFLGAARGVAAALGARRRAIDDLGTATDDALAAATRETSATLTEIARLDRAIAASEAGGTEAATLRDQRTTAVQALAAAMDVRVLEGADGTLTITTVDGTALVAGGAVRHDVVTVTDAAGHHQLRLVDDRGAVLDVAAAFARGRLVALRQMRDDEIGDAIARLDAFAASFADLANAVQTDTAARDMDGQPTATAALFAYDPDRAAATLAVVLGDARRVAAARVVDEAGTVDSAEQARRFGAMRTATPLDGATLEGWLAAETTRLGTRADEATDRAVAAALAIEQATLEREAVSGVNLEEELTALIRVQRAYQAAARVVSVADGLLNDLLGLIR